MATAALSDERILEKGSEEKLNPLELNEVLLFQTHLASRANVDVMKQYRMDNYHESVRQYADSHYYDCFLRQRDQAESTRAHSEASRMEEGKSDL